MINRINISYKRVSAILIASIILFGFVSFIFINTTHATTPADERRRRELHDNAPNPNAKGDYSKNYNPTTYAQYGYDATKDGAKPLITPKNRSYIVVIPAILMTVLVVSVLIYRKQHHSIKNNKTRQ